MTSKNESLTYASSGVNIDTESASVKALISALGPVAHRKSGTFGAPVDHSGGFSGLIEFGDNLLALCTDGVGSKLLLAAQMDVYDTVAIDCMAMNVNDLLCIGAEPIAFVDYIAAPRPDAETWAALGRGLGEACRRARVSLCGGETASLPDMVREIDVSGTALGWLPKGMQLEGRVTSGDSIIGLPSSGIHSNGFSLVRKILMKSGLSLDDAAPFDIGPRADGLWRHSDGDVQLGEVLLNPTMIYVDPVVDLLQTCRGGDGPCSYDDIHGIAHITGGGLSNLLRLGADIGFVIDDALEVLPEFEWMQASGEISDFEMWRTFNMGMGMAMVVSHKSCDAVCRWLQERLAGCKRVGYVDAERRVLESNSGVSFDKY
ncbi:Phosphoribosylformylglycinamidine cyclo-ligase [Gracilariopsis chorda]|uniref:phosphoribosylformylglycinamidine cyclo-ligase n=1 Tax=Gracilariopsis chorda TaxID=448386 RepID=A0A2V3IPY0_9FLOR|nr:Phosphoribosylformylglycinamidine cyclo-ligase [Gracilariopsis chorda]|eukprot:PXF44136.1 Phosphoribosylformylglycinamidine cyclo-ligase [Gracilariopsis chorda]